MIRGARQDIFGNVIQTVREVLHSVMFSQGPAASVVEKGHDLL